jgi:hypothetical protein
MPLNPEDRGNDPAAPSWIGDSMKQAILNTGDPSAFLAEHPLCEPCELIGLKCRATAVLDPDDPVAMRAVCAKHVGAPDEVLCELRADDRNW